jgi:uncharacterized membrane protein YgcG
VFAGADYELTKSGKPPGTLLEPELELFGALFFSGDVVKISDFKKDRIFAKALADIKKQVYKNLTASGYYRLNPNVIKGTLISVGIIIAIFGSAFLSDYFGAYGIVSFVISGLVIIIFGLLMPARTQKGAELREYILGLKLYMKVAEKDRLEFHNAPEKNPARFELLLPFAIALGVEQLWAKQFEGILKNSPSWYSDSRGIVFNPVLFSGSMSEFGGVVNSTMNSAAASGGSGLGGGGFSGGGGGGGGGGSW